MKPFRKITRRPTHPGEILWKEFLEPDDVSVEDFAEKIDVEVEVIQRLIDGKQSVTEELAKKFGNALDTTSQIWLNLQMKVDHFDKEGWSW